MLARLARSQASGRGAVGSVECVVRDLLEVPDVKPPRHKPLIDAILGKQVYLCVCRGRGEVGAAHLPTGVLACTTLI
jgi:hypothetical protein